MKNRHLPPLIMLAEDLSSWPAARTATLALVPRKVEPPADSSKNRAPESAKAA